MIVVADASPFVVLVAIGHLDVLPTLFHEILIPPEVASELGSSKRPAEVRSFIAVAPSSRRGRESVRPAVTSGGVFPI